jgi:SAM-dependent methyltransferase
MTAPPLIFDRDQLRQKFRRPPKENRDFNFLRDWAAKELTSRLSDIKRTFPVGLLCAPPLSPGVLEELQKTAGTDTLFSNSLSRHGHTCTDEEFFPYANEKLDAIFNILNLHNINDLPGTLIQMRRALKPDGLFMAALFGGETLRELKTSLQQTELEIKNGYSPRVFPFIDKQDAGALLQRAGFTLPVVDSERLTVTYPNIFKLMTDLRGMGETNILHQRDKTIPAKAFFPQVGQYYADHFSDEDGQIEATFDIIFMIGWAPHESQQKPMKPGSASHSLHSFLTEKEQSDD